MKTTNINSNFCVVSRILLFSLLLFFTALTFAQKVLKPEEAFPVEVIYKDQRLQISHEITVGYYLYKDKISYDSIDQNINLGTTQLPPGKAHFDEFFGNTEIYRDAFIVDIPVDIDATTIMDNALFIEIKLQGCADIGLCYPPQTWQKEISLNQENDGGMIRDNVVNQSEQGRLGNLIAEGNIFLVCITFLGLGFMLAFTPCHLPTIPILSSIILGQTGETNTLKSLSLSLTYVAGMAITYSAAGIMAALAGQQLQAVFTLPVVLIAIAILFTWLGLSMLGRFNIQIPSLFMNKINTLQAQQKGGTYVGVLMMGGLSALLVTACVAPPLVATLIVIGQSASIMRGILALSSLSLGLGIPLILIGLTAGKWLPRTGDWLNSIKEIFGLIMFGLAIWILNPLMSQDALAIVWALFFVVVGIYLGGLKLNAIILKRISSIRIYTGFVVMLIGFALLFNQTIGIKSINENENENLYPDADSLFTTIRSIEDLNQSLNVASSSHQITLLYYTADWCVSCRQLERDTFTNQALIDLLSEINSIKADLSLNNDNDKELMNSFGVYGPPTMLLFNNQGLEQTHMRKIGMVKAEELLGNLNELKLIP
jgi:thiol:disulfide interchange protein DsbD